jgi:predicted membrane protein
VFGGVKKNVVSKNFKGGEINNVFGGSEINLTQADFTGIITLEINNVFGGTKLIVPSHWQLKSEITAVMGGVEDRRNIQPNSGIVPDKILIINGNTFFGGIDIRNY